MIKNLLIASALGFVALGMAGDDLSYRDRGNRHEGAKPKPIGGYDIELLGVMVEPVPVSSVQFQDKVAISFFLEREEPVHFLARELMSREFYWLDQVKPPSPWRPRATSTFSWPSSDVLRPLGLRPADLLFLVRLGHDKPRLEERVAPVLFEPAPSGRKISGYRFTFRTQATAKTRHALYGPGSTKPLEPVPPYSPRAADTPFAVSWNAEGRTEGNYRLVVEGYFTADNQRFTQGVEFFHSPVWPD